MKRHITSPFKHKALLFAIGHLLCLIAAFYTTAYAPYLMPYTILAYCVVMLLLASRKIGLTNASATCGLALLFSVYGWARAFALVESILSPKPS